MMEKIPRVSIGVIIEKEGKFLLGQRFGSHGEGEWCFPGGHVDYGESLEQACQRELKEETGLNASEFEFVCVVEEKRYIESDGKHFVMIGFKAKSFAGEPQEQPEEKTKNWTWFDKDKLPQPLLEATGIFIDKYNKGQVF